MPATFFERLTARAKAIDSLLCVGLDPRADSLEELRHQCGRLIDATVDVGRLLRTATFVNGSENC